MNDAAIVTRKRQRRFIFIAFFALTLFGALMIYEASSVYAFKTTADPAYFFKRQMLFAFVGLLFFSLTLLVDLEFLRIHAKQMLLFTIFCLVIVMIFGKTVGGAKRWLSLASFNIQPSEILKITFLIYCADYCQRKRSLLNSIRLGLIPLGLVLGLVCTILILQPDLGTAILWVIWTILFLFLFGAKKKHLFFVIIFGLVVLFFLVKLYPYRLKRIISYLNPFADPRGSGFQLIQSQIAYGLGGIWGVGLGESLQKLSFFAGSSYRFCIFDSR